MHRYHIRLHRVVTENNGMTLMEIIIAIALMSIIVIAALRGLQFAYYTFITSEEYISDAYTLQGNMERDLSVVNSLVGDEDALAIEALLAEDVIETYDETIYFDWQTGSGLSDFKTVGVTVEREAVGGTHINTPVYIFIPIDNDDQ